MKKIIWAGVLGCVLLLTGCKGSELEKAKSMMSQGDYGSAIEILEGYANDDAAAPLLKEAKLEKAVIDAQAAIESKDYAAAASLLEEFKDEEKASELYSAAKKQVNIETLAGKWQNIGGDTLNGAVVFVTFTGDTGKGMLLHSVDNYYGYFDLDDLWSSIKLPDDGSLSVTARKRDISGNYTDVTAETVLDTEAKTLTFSDTFLGTWKKISDSEADAAIKDSHPLTKTYKGDTIDKTSFAVTEFGKRVNDITCTVCYSTDEVGDSPFALLYYYNDKTDNFVPYNGYVQKNGSLSDDIYCGMTMSQLIGLNSRGVITGFTHAAASEYDTDPYYPYEASYKCVCNGVERELSLFFRFDDSEEYVEEIFFGCDAMFQEHQAEVEQKRLQQQQEEERRRQEEEQRRQEEQAKQDYAYSTDGLINYMGTTKEYIYGNGERVAVCEPWFGAAFTIGDICFIENFSALDNSMYLYQMGYLRETNRYVTYKGNTYPVYRAVTVLQ